MASEEKRAVSFDSAAVRWSFRAGRSHPIGVKALSRRRRTVTTARVTGDSAEAERRPHRPAQPDRALQSRTEVTPIPLTVDRTAEVERCPGAGGTRGRGDALASPRRRRENQGRCCAPTIRWNWCSRGRHISEWMWEKCRLSKAPKRGWRRCG